MADILQWPWPRLFPTQYRTLLVTRQASNNLVMSEVHLTRSGYWVTIPILNLGSYLNVVQVDVADFGPFFVVSTMGRNSDGELIIQSFKRNVDNPIELEGGTGFDPIISPRVGTICNFNGQFVGANILADGESYWDGYETRGMIWSAIGNFELSPLEDVTSGYRRLFLDSSLGVMPFIYKVLQFGNGVAVYSDAGNVILEPELVGDTYTFSPKPMQSLGVRSGNHVAGDQHVHGFIDSNGDFWTLGKPVNVLVSSNTLVRRGYREFINVILAESTNVIVTYISRNSTFYISNGIRCLIVNFFGAYHAHQLPSSVVESFGGALIGTFIDTLDVEARITTDVLDYNSRNIKSVESITADLSHALTSRAYYAVDWRMDKSKGYSRSGWKFDGLSGMAGIHVAGVDFRLAVKVSNYSEVILNLLLANVKFSGQSFKRGTVPAQFNAGGEG